MSRLYVSTSFSVFKRTDCLVVFADVGQGDCCLIITSDKTCLIDAGTYKEGSSTVCDLLDYYGLYQVDYCIMSHWDSDHAGGVAALSDQGRIKSILTSYIPSPMTKTRTSGSSLNRTFSSLKPNQPSVLNCHWFWRETG